MQRLGFIHDIVDVKVLILFVTARSQYPMTMQELYEVCYQDDCLSYFDVCTAVPQMIETGHLQEVESDRYAITEKGREAGALVEDSIAFTVKQRAEDAVDSFNRQLRRKSYIKTQQVAKENGEYSVEMTLDDDFGSLMKLELSAPNQRQALRLSKLLEAKAETIYNLTMSELLSEEEKLD